MHIEECFQYICPEEMTGAGYLYLVTNPQKFSLKSRPIFSPKIVSDNTTTHLTGKKQTNPKQNKQKQQTNKTKKHGYI